MSLEERRKEAEAILDSAEMILETMPHSNSADKLRIKIDDLEAELQDPDSERSLKKLIDQIRDLMDEMQEEPVPDDDVMGPEPGIGGGGAPPNDDVPPPM